MRDRWSEFERRGAEALAVSFAQPAELLLHAYSLALPFDLAADPGRIAYDRYGVGRASAWQVWHPLVTWWYLKARARGERARPTRKGDDRRQLGADFIIGADGRILWAYRCRRPDDRPPVEALLEALDGQPSGA